jgi:uncharacterized protein (DUF1697 family)
VDTYIALLRGINVGGNKMISMAEFRALLLELGLQDVKTLLQSGNAVFRAEGQSDRELETFLQDHTAERLKVRCEFFVRKPRDWDKVISNNPFPEAAKSDPSHLVVLFTKDVPDSKAVESVQLLIQGPEQIKVKGGQLYITYPDGIGNSKVSKTPGFNKLCAAGTARNWNTVLKLQALAASL